VGEAPSGNPLRPGDEPATPEAAKNDIE
jgi:hypothetical protein